MSNIRWALMKPAIIRKLSRGGMIDIVDVMKWAYAGRIIVVPTVGDYLEVRAIDRGGSFARDAWCLRIAQSLVSRRALRHVLKFAKFSDTLKTRMRHSYIEEQARREYDGVITLHEFLSWITQPGVLVSDEGDSIVLKRYCWLFTKPSADGVFLGWWAKIAKDCFEPRALECVRGGKGKGGLVRSKE